MVPRSGILPVLVALANLAPACAPPDGGRLALRLRVARRAVENPTRGGPAPERGQPPPDIEGFRLCVQDRPGQDLACRDFTDLGSPEYRVDGIPVGDDRVVTFQGYAADPESQEIRVIWCGRATRVDIRDAEVTPVSMLLSLCSDVTSTPGSPAQPRTFHTATRLPDGRVLFTGGFIPATGVDCGPACVVLDALRHAEVYDPAEGTFEALEGELVHPRGFHAAAPLEDGRILVAGGCERVAIMAEFPDPDVPGPLVKCLARGEAATSAEVYDPAGGTSEEVDIPAAVFAGGVALGENRLLLVGGEVSDEPAVYSRDVVLVDAASSPPAVTTVTNCLEAGRRSATCSAFSPDGEDPVEILVVGGLLAPGEDDPGVFAERLVVGSGQIFSLVPPFVEESLGKGLPVMHAASTRLAPGRLLVSGGVHPARFDSKETPFLPVPLRTAARLDMRLEDFELLGPDARLAVARSLHTSTRVDRRGRTLVAGGWTRQEASAPLLYEATASLEMWDEEYGAFTLWWLGGDPVSMLHPRAGHTATLLDDGTVLWVGGLDRSGVLTQAEIFNPVSAKLGEGGPPAL